MQEFVIITEGVLASESDSTQSKRIISATLVNRPSLEVHAHCAASMSDRDQHVAAARLFVETRMHDLLLPSVDRLRIIWCSADFSTVDHPDRYVHIVSVSRQQ